LHLIGLLTGEDSFVLGLLVQGLMNERTFGKRSMKLT